VGGKERGHVTYTSSITKREEIAGFAPVPGHDWVVGVFGVARLLSPRRSTACSRK